MTPEGIMEMALRAAEGSKEYLDRCHGGQVVDPSRDAAHALPGYVRLLVRHLNWEIGRSDKFAAQLDDYLAAKRYLEGEFGDIENDDGEPATLREMVEWLT